MTMTTQDFFKKIDDHFFTPSKLRLFEKFAEGGRQQEMWVNGMLTCLFDLLLEESSLSHWEPQFPLSEFLPLPSEGKLSQEKIDFKIVISQSSDPIYLELKAVPWYLGDKEEFNFALFNSGYLPDDVVKLANIKNGQRFCLVFLYPSPESDLENWKKRLGKFIEKQKPIQVSERVFANGQHSEHLYIAKLEVSYGGV